MKWVYHAFKDVKSKGFEARLEQPISGKVFYTEDSHDPARDYLYELVVASWLKNKGYTLDFDSPDNTDVVARRGDTEIFIECKQLKSSNGYEENYKKECKQLKKIYDNHKDAIKLVCIDIYNCISDKIIPYEYSNYIRAAESLQNVMSENFINCQHLTTSRIQDEYKDYVDGVVFTSICNLGISKNNDIEIGCCCRQEVNLQESASDNRKQKIITALNTLN